MATKTKKTEATEQEAKRQGNLTLQPLDFDEALAAFLNTPPPPKPAKPATKKKTAKKAAKK